VWYYELSQKAFGPVSNESIIEELKAGRITRMTLVWRQGWPQWKCLGETELAANFHSIKQNVMAPASVNSHVNNLKKNKVSATELSQTFWWWFGFNLFMLPLDLSLVLVFSDQITGGTWMIAMGVFSLIPLFAGGFLQFALIYRFWQVVQDGFTRISPGKAVGFMFIPYFNFYWILPLYHGLAKDLNSYIERHFNSSVRVHLRKAHPGLALSFVISFWVLGLLAGLFGVVYFLVIFPFFIHSESISKIFQTYLIPAIILNGFWFIFELIVYFDFLVSAKSILEAKTQTA
jgi:hypothetical protein